MRRFLTLLSVLALLAIVVPVAAAANAHFNSASDSINSKGQLVVTWKEVGLGNNLSISYVASADATAMWGCVNKGGNHPQATNKTTVNGPVSATGAFSSGKNGSITGSLTMGPPSAPAAWGCPGNQVVKLIEVAYSGVILTDNTTPVSVTLPNRSLVLY